MCNIEITKDSQCMTLSLIKVHYSTASVMYNIKGNPRKLGKQVLLGTDDFWKRQAFLDNQWFYLEKKQATIRTLCQMTRTRLPTELDTKPFAFPHC